MSRHSITCLTSEMCIRDRTITKQIEKAQKKIENNNFGIRRNLLDYDPVSYTHLDVYKRQDRSHSGFWQAV